MTRSQGSWNELQGQNLGSEVSVERFLNLNHRHDDPKEQEHDRIREKIRKGHRFQSFADIRDNNTVKWHIDGHDYFWALSEILDSAKKCIFILDWWLSPEMYLRRPPADNQEWGLDSTRIISVRTLSDSAAQFCSHHEKAVVVDDKRACIGGLDACFWDGTHIIITWQTLTLPAFQELCSQGKTYNNARVLDFQQVDHYVNTQISSLEIGRMPWHDVHMILIGPSCSISSNTLLSNGTKSSFESVVQEKTVHYYISTGIYANKTIVILTGWCYLMTSKPIPNTRFPDIHISSASAISGGSLNNTGKMRSARLMMKTEPRPMELAAFRLPVVLETRATVN
ncbi:unnamed protein product [Rhizoctonia solani]|uniref:phospholipase D n=1 Tax=Rhizoctonia solani TaxID=456999 RepID=A0A8H3GLF1_9AGAM|nr:unnamed protein product [Rhizoctonia solani]